MGTRTAICLTSVTPEPALISFYFSKLANMSSILASEARTNHTSHTRLISIPALFCRMWRRCVTHAFKVTKPTAATAKGQVPLGLCWDHKLCAGFPYNRGLTHPSSGDLCQASQCLQQVKALPYRELYPKDI